MDRRRESLRVVCAQEKSIATRRTPSCSPRAATETCFISRPTHAAAMSQPPIVLTKEAQCLPIHPLPRFIHLDFNQWANIIQAHGEVRVGAELMKGLGYGTEGRLASA